MVGPFPKKKAPDAVEIFVPFTVNDTLYLCPETLPVETGKPYAVMTFPTISIEVGVIIVEAPFLQTTFDIVYGDVPPVMVTLIEPFDTGFAHANLSTERVAVCAPT